MSQAIEKPTTGKPGTVAPALAGKASEKPSGIMAILRSSGEWIVPIAAVSMVFVMLVPLPSFLLDLLLTISITASVLVLLTAIQILRPVQFSVFPSLLLLLTLLRLSLDLASTRRILLHGNEGSSAAGKVKVWRYIALGFPSSNSSMKAWRCGRVEVLIQV